MPSVGGMRLNLMCAVAGGVVAVGAAPVSAQIVAEKIGDGIVRFHESAKAKA